jgi:hypothetical protein
MIKAWSLTGLLNFESCAYRAFLQYVQKAEQPIISDPNHPLERGKRIHAEVEDYISGKTDDFPSSGKKLKDEILFCKEKFQEGNAVVEEKWGFTDEWVDTGFFDDNVWCRMVTDAYIKMDEDSAIVYDWKTGKSFGNEVKYMQQMQLYGIGALLRSPELELVDVHLGFLDDGKIRSKVFRRGNKLNRLLQRFTERGERMVKCTAFPAKPNPVNCKWCPFGPTGTNACVYGAEGI